MPVLNPDGYVYSHEYDRFWKKSRSQHVAKPSGGLLDSAMTWLQQKRTGGEKICYGVDLDRNWLYHWGKRGSSKAPCNEFYAGPAPFSEPETKAVSDFLMDYRTQIKVVGRVQKGLKDKVYYVKEISFFFSALHITAGLWAGAILSGQGKFHLQHGAYGRLSRCGNGGH